LCAWVGDVLRVVIEQKGVWALKSWRAGSCGVGLEIRLGEGDGEGGVGGEIERGITLSPVPR